MSSPEDKGLRKLFEEIWEGCSPLKYNGETIYIKHFTFKDQRRVDHVEAQMLEHARTQGLPTTNEALGFLEQEKLWTSDDSAKLQNQEEYVTKLQHTFTTLLLDAQKKTMGAQLEVERKTLIRLQRQKASLLRDTCESYVQNKIGNETLFYSFYKDPTLKELYLSREDFEHLDPAELRVLAGLYNLATEHLDIERIKDLALDPLFVNYYSLASGSPHEFFRGNYSLGPLIR